MRGENSPLTERESNVKSKRKQSSEKPSRGFVNGSKNTGIIDFRVLKGVSLELSGEGGDA